MIKIENIETWGFEHAIRGMKAKGYRKTKTGYEAFCSDHGKCINLGTYKTEEEAKDAVVTFRINRFKELCKKIGLNAEDGIEYDKNYIAFPSGKVLNLHGHEMIGAISKDGYRHIIINKKNKDVHRIIAEVFIPNPNNLEQVNHIDGCKTNNNVNNLEWCTRADNIKHAYSTGLETKMCGEHHHAHKLTQEDVGYIRDHIICGDREYGYTALAKKFGVDKSTIYSIIKKRTWKHI